MEFMRTEHGRGKDIILCFEVSYFMLELGRVRIGRSRE